MLILLNHFFLSTCITVSDCYPYATAYCNKLPVKNAELFSWSRSTIHFWFTISFMLSSQWFNSCVSRDNDEINLELVSSLWNGDEANFFRSLWTHTPKIYSFAYIVQDSTNFARSGPLNLFVLDKKNSRLSVFQHPETTLLRSFQNQKQASDVTFELLTTNRKIFHTNRSPFNLSYRGKLLLPFHIQSSNEKNLVATYNFVISDWI